MIKKYYYEGHSGGLVVITQNYKPPGRGFESDSYICLRDVFPYVPGESIDEAKQLNSI